jgi:cation:H+ antiporter
MVVVSFACLPIFFTDHRIDRWEGVLFLVYYGVYLAYLILAETNAVAAHKLAVAIALFVIPLTAVTLFVFVLRSMKPAGERRE